MSFLRKLKSSKHILKKGDNFLANIEETTYFDLNQRDLIVYHIDSETEGTFSLTVKNDDSGETVLDRVCDHYNLHNYKEYFGLKYTLVDDSGDHEILWLDSCKTIGKQLKDTNNVLTFRVKHFPGKPQNIESEYVRYLIFLQIRNYLLKGDLQLALADDIKLAAYAVQASLGDYDPLIHKGNYLADIKFLSRKSFKAEEKIMELHKELKGKTPADMEMAFLEKASQFDTYGAELIVVKTSKGVPINFGVSHNGIITYLHGTPANIAKIDMFPWNQIGKISCEHRTLRVHFHTPDRENSEIIKKQVMVFKCNNSRICKHLWKFILDQKAFFNFKRGVDVPKIKSSSRLFTFKSKFRFSGRCERELIQAQVTKNSREHSLCSSMEFSNSLSTDPNDTTTSTNTINSLNRSAQLSEHSSSTLCDRNFKRRTFQPTPRSFFRPKHIELVPQPINDANNNQLDTDPTPKQLSTVDEAIAKLNEHVTAKLSAPTRTEIDPVSTDLDVDAQAQATSTPHLVHKTSTSSAEKAVNVETNEEVAASGSETEDEFFEHDYYKTESKSLVGLDDIEEEQVPSQIGENLESKAFYAHNSSVSSEAVQELKPLSLAFAKLKSCSCSLLIVVCILFIFFFFLVLIQHWKCTLSSTASASIINPKSAPNCNYQKTLNKLGRNLHTSAAQIMDWVLGRYGTNMSWSLAANSTNILDPFFSWFLDQYQEK